MTERPGEEERFSYLYQEFPAGCLVLDESLVIREVNRFGCEQLGYPAGELRGMAFTRLCYSEEREFVEQNLRQCLHERSGNRRWECMRLRKDGSRFWVRDSVRVVEDGRGNLLLLIASEDVSETRYLINELERKSSVDELTGLYNRRKFDFFLEEHVLSVQTAGSSHVLFYIDLDHFKVVNDTCGHLLGDRFLRQVATALRQATRSHDILGRLGGDEFGLILVSCSLDEALAVGEKILVQLGELRFSGAGQTFVCGASIGVVPLQAGNGDATASLAQADTACYVAKAQGRNRIHVYMGDSDRGARADPDGWFSRLHEAFEKDRFVLYGQRILALKGPQTGSSFFEVLLRLRDADGGVIGPGAFMSTAERYNLDTRIDRWVTRRLITSEVVIANKNVSTYFVNLSGQTLGDGGFIEEAQGLLRDRPGIAERLCFEITESAAIRNLEAARSFIERFRALGCRFALDDFGSGFSSFGYLKGLPVDFIKVDGGFVTHIHKNPLDQAVVRAIYEVARAFGKQTIAEWVENEAAMDMIRGMGIDYAQGFQIARPAPLLEAIG